MTPAAIRALIHEHRAAGRHETVLAMEAMLAIVEEVASGMQGDSIWRGMVIERARKVLA